MGEEATGEFVLDPDKGAFVSAFGPKDYGKSHLCELYFRAYPYDRLVIDANDDVDLEGAYTTTAPPIAFDLVKVAPNQYDARVLHEFWPEPEGGLYASVRYPIDQLDPFWLEKAVAVCWHVAKLKSFSDPTRPRPKCIWIDEIGEIALAGGACPGKVNQLLHKGRHDKLTFLLAGPRPSGVNPLVLSQADLVALFSCPHELDRDRLAGTLGFRREQRQELDSLLDNLDAHQYVAYLSRDRSVAEMPAVPEDLSEFDYPHLAAPS